MAHSAAIQPTASENNCPICFSTLVDPHQLSGWSHACCRTCLIQSLTYLPHCPVCRVKAQIDEIVPAGAAPGITARDQALTTVSRLGQPYPGLSGFTMPAAGSVNDDIQNWRLRTMANQSSAFTAASPIRLPTFRSRRSRFTPDLHMPTSTTSSPTTAPADSTYMAAGISAPIAPAHTPTPRTTLRSNLGHHLQTGSALRSQLWEIGQHRSSPFQRPTSLDPRAARPVLADSQAMAALESFDDDISYTGTDDALSSVSLSTLGRTFVCPFCLKSDLDEMELLDHCNDNHPFDNRPMVCPICVSLPHGDPNQISRNFIRHLNLRHCYYTDDYMNIRHSETQNLQTAIFESLQDVNQNTFD